MDSPVCSVENLLLLGQDKLHELCRVYKIPITNDDLFNAISIKNHYDATQKEIRRLEQSLGSPEQSAGTPGSDHIFANSNEPFVTYSRRRPIRVSGHQNIDDVQVHASLQSISIDQDVHYSDPILPPYMYRDELESSSLDDTLLSIHTHVIRLIPIPLRKPTHYL